jgi:hypothetical protein
MLQDGNSDISNGKSFFLSLSLFAFSANPMKIFHAFCRYFVELTKLDRFTSFRPQGPPQVGLQGTSRSAGRPMPPCRRGWSRSDAPVANGLTLPKTGDGQSEHSPWHSTPFCLYSPHKKPMLQHGPYGISDVKG